jgi:hypothetical protein
MLFPCKVSVNAGLPAAAEFGAIEVREGGGGTVAGLERVKGNELDAPAEFDIVTRAVPGKAAFVAGMEAVICVALTKVVGCAAPFQFTIASLVKFVPFTVSVNPWALQDGVEAADVVDAERDVIAGGVPGAAPIVKRTMFEIAVVVVLLMFCVGETAEPGISMATCTVPVVARSEAGTGAVNCMLLTRVVFRAVPFHRISAPVVKPCPLAVIVKPGPPTVAVLGLTKVKMEDAVWMERFVL